MATMQAFLLEALDADAVFVAARRGDFAVVDPTLERLIGRPPEDMRGVLKGFLQAG